MVEVAVVVVVAVEVVVIVGGDMEHRRTVQMDEIRIIEKMDVISRSIHIEAVLLEEEDAGDTDSGIITRRRRRLQRTTKGLETRMETIKS